MIRRLLGAHMPDVYDQSGIDLTGLGPPCTVQKSQCHKIDPAGRDNVNQGEREACRGPSEETSAAASPQIWKVQPELDLATARIADFRVDH